MTAVGKTTFAPPAVAARVSDVITHVLHHPWAMAAKRAVRDLRWRMSGTALQNPPLPAPVGSLLFVCLGNICRSPFAGYLAARRLADRGRDDIRVSSAGTRGNQSQRSPADACAAAAAFGISLEEHRPILLTPELAETHDLILVMEPEQVAELRRTYPHVAHRVFLLPDFDLEARGYARSHIDDPFLGPAAGFVRCYDQIDRAVSGLLDAVGAARTGSPR